MSDKTSTPAEKISDPTPHMTLAEKLAEIRKIIEVIQKDKSGYGYKYTSINEILSRLTTGENEFKIMLIPRLIGAPAIELKTFEKTKVKKSGEVYDEKSIEYLFTSQMEFEWKDLESEDSIYVPWFYCGSQTDPAQAFGSAATYGLRYFLLQFFQIATPEDDPDNWRSKQAEAEDEMNAKIAKEITKEINQFVNTYLAAHSDKKDEVSEIIKKHVRDKSGKPSANYMTITDPIAATRLYEALKAECK